MHEFLVKIANFIDSFRFVDQISFKVKEVLVQELENQNYIPWDRTDIFINKKNLRDILKEYEKLEAQNKNNEIELAGMYDGIEPRSIENQLKDANGEISLYQCSKCHSSACGAHLYCKITKGLIFTTLSNFEQKPYTSNDCVHVETKVKVFWDYSKFRPIRFYKWQLNKALKNV